MPKDKDTKERKIDALEERIKADKDKGQDKQIAGILLRLDEIDKARKRLPWMLLAALASVISGGAILLVQLATDRAEIEAQARQAWRRIQRGAPCRPQRADDRQRSSSQA